MGGQVRLAPRFRVQPEFAHGGYVCGVVASVLPNARTVESTLRSRPPLDKPLTVSRRGDGTVALMDGETLIAESRASTLELEVPPLVSLPEATAAAATYPNMVEHAFPECFVCGPQRSVGDGLRLFPWKVPGHTVVAAPWTPDVTLVGADGTVPPEVVWSVLECVSGHACYPFYEPLLAAGEEVATLLGRITARLESAVHGAAPHVVMSWPIAMDGRRWYAGTAVYTANGSVCALGKSTWFRIR